MKTCRSAAADNLVPSNKKTNLYVCEYQLNMKHGIYILNADWDSEQQQSLFLCVFSILIYRFVFSVGSARSNSNV